MGGGVRGGARGGRGGARKEPVKSKEDLDAEMDVYMSSLIMKKLKYLKLAWPGCGAFSLLYSFLLLQDYS